MLCHHAEPTTQGAGPPGVDSGHAGCRSPRTHREPHRRAYGRGGACGRFRVGLLFIDLFFLPDNLRGDGLGSRLLRLAEDEARQRGCVGAVLYTINFQAPGFYERHGYRVLGTVPCLPPGTSRIFMTKSLI
ncbi:MAG: GNAT family N-acetyltransferase [Candidatus Rokuibacteriota bacterium]|nr:MAG: GNAT family N-acetyltransferase [Candidatus Rokubacteria bacterium]